MPEHALKPGWRAWRFDEMARNVTDRVDDPAKAGVDRYVGLEHLDSDSLRIRRWGAPTDVEATKLRFKKGDIVFGRRRAYQRKLAVADFDGICSAHAMVLRARPDVVLPEFLPFFMQADPFMKRAQEISVGSLSPTVNWKALAREEFVIPCIEEQQRIASVLTVQSSIGDALVDALTAAERLNRATIGHLYTYGTKAERRERTPLGPLPESWEVAPLDAHYSVQLGKMMSEGARRGANPTPYLRNANVQWNRLDLSDVAEMSFSPTEREKFSLRNGDVLACEGRHVGKSAIWREEIPDACYQKALHRLRRRDEQQVPEFLLHCLQFYHWTGRFRAMTGETTIPHLPAERFRSMLFPFPPRQEQEAIVERIRAGNEGTRALEARLQQSSYFHRELVGAALDGGLR